MWSAIFFFHNYRRYEWLRSEWDIFYGLFNKFNILEMAGLGVFCDYCFTKNIAKIKLPRRRFKTLGHQILYRHLVVKNQLRYKAEILHAASHWCPLPGSQSKFILRGHWPLSKIKILPEKKPKTTSTWWNAPINFKLKKYSYWDTGTIEPMHSKKNVKSNSCVTLNMFACLCRL